MACGGAPNTAGNPGDASTEAPTAALEAGSDAPTGAAADAPIDLADAGAEAACSSYLAAYCTKLQSCDPVDFYGLFFGTVAQCESRLTPSCLARIAAPGTAATPAAVPACGQATSGEDCAAFLTGPPPGPCIWSGSLANGTHCEFDAQCESTHCASGTDTWCGVCQPRAAVGQSCLSASCQYGLVCLAAGGSTCAQPVAQGGPCDTRDQCVLPLTCAQGTCSPRAPIGESCAAGLDCALGAYCERDSGLCAALSYGAAGDPCEEGAGRLCSAGTGCRDSAGTPSPSGTCVALAADGLPCVSSADCLVPSRCVGTRCTPAVPAASCQ
jgi:hypothetical protein